MRKCVGLCHCFFVVNLSATVLNIVWLSTLQYSWKEIYFTQLTALRGRKFSDKRCGGSLTHWKGMKGVRLTMLKVTRLTLKSSFPIESFGLCAGSPWWRWGYITFDSSWSRLKQWVSLNNRRGLSGCRGPSASVPAVRVCLVLLLVFLRLIGTS